MKFHDIANVFPLMTDAELDVLAEDIRVNKLRDAIWVHPDDGSIIDGRNRFLACQRIGIVPRTRTWDRHGSLVAFVLSANLHRRQLQIGQRAMIAARLANLPLGGAFYRNGNIGASGEAPISERDAAALLNVSRASVQRAGGILRRALPDVVAAVDRGDVSVDAGNRIGRLPDADQRAAIAKGPRAIATIAEASRRTAQPANPHKTVAATATRRKRIADLAAEGYHSAQIADAVGMTPESVHAIFKKHHIECPGDRATGRRRRVDSRRILTYIVMTAEELITDHQLIDFATIDHAELPAWIASLTASHKALGSFIRQLRIVLDRGQQYEGKVTAASVEDPSRSPRTH